MSIYEHEWWCRTGYGDILSKEKDENGAFYPFYTNIFLSSLSFNSSISLLMSSWLLSFFYLSPVLILSVNKKNLNISYCVLDLKVSRKDCGELELSEIAGDETKEVYI